MTPQPAPRSARQPGRQHGRGGGWGVEARGHAGASVAAMASLGWRRPWEAPRRRVGRAADPARTALPCTCSLCLPAEKEVEVMDEDPAYIFRFPTPPDVGEQPSCAARGCPDLAHVPRALGEAGCLLLPYSAALGRRRKLCPCAASARPCPLPTFCALPPGPCPRSVAAHPGLHRRRLWLPRGSHPLPQPELWVRAGPACRRCALLTGRPDHVPAA